MIRTIILLFCVGQLQAQNLSGFTNTTDNQPKPINSAKKRIVISPSQNGVGVALQNPHTSQIINVASSKTGKFIFTAANDNTLKLWDAQLKKILQTFTIENTLITQSYFFSNDSLVLLIGGNATIYLYSIHDSKIEKLEGLNAGFIQSALQIDNHKWILLNSSQVVQLNLTPTDFSINVIYNSTSIEGSFKKIIKLPNSDFHIFKTNGIEIFLKANGDSEEINIPKKPSKFWTGTTPLNVPPVVNIFAASANFSIKGADLLMNIYKKGKKHDRVFSNRIEHLITDAVVVNQNSFAWINDGGEITFYNAVNKKVYYRKVFKSFRFSALAIDTTNNFLYIGDKEGALHFFDISTFTFTPANLKYTGVEDVDFDTKGNHIIWSDNQGFLNTMELSSGKFKTANLKLDNFELTAVKYSPTHHTILAAGFKNRLYEVSIGDTMNILRKKMLKKVPSLRNISYLTSKLIGKPERSRFQVTEIGLFNHDSVATCFMVNNKPFVVLRAMYNVLILPKSPEYYNTFTFSKESRPYPKPKGVFGNLSYSVEGYMINSMEKNKLRFVSTPNTMQFAVLFKEDHNGLLSGVVGTKNSIISSGRDGSLQLWQNKLDNPNRICTIYPGEKGEKLMINDANFYWGTHDVLNKVGFNYKGKFFFPDQLDFIYNRPDLVLKSIDSTLYSELIKTFYHAYQKRLKKAGLTEELISTDLDNLPVLEINQGNTKENQAIFTIATTTASNEIQKINVWNNGVPVFGVNGLSSLNKNENRSVSIPLIAGVNKIQFSILTKSGKEGFRNTFLVQGESNNEKPELYYVGLGCSIYNEEQYNLTYAAKDVTDLNEALKKSTKFSKVNSLLITNNELTKESVKSIKSFLLQSKPCDQVILFYAGHGVLDKEYNYYLTPSNTNFSSPSSNAIPYEWLESQLDSIPAYRKLLLLDACHSGDLDKEDLLALATAESSNTKDIKFRKVGSTQYGYVSGTAFELSRELFVDMRRGTGTTVISSAGGLEFAMEGKSWNNGLFTYCLLNGIQSRKADSNRDKSISVSEIKEYVQTQVKLISNGLQAPTSRSENIEFDYLLW